MPAMFRADVGHPSSAAHRVAARAALRTSVAAESARGRDGAPGGERPHVCRRAAHTRCQDGESVLAQMLTAPNRQLHTTAGGQVVLDVDADAFAQIVLWLRTGVAPRGHTVDEAAVLRHYANVLSLRRLVAALGGEPAPPTEAQPSDPAVGSFPDASPEPSLVLADASSGPPNAGDRQPNFTQTRLLECMQVRLVLFAPLGRLTSHTGGV